MRKGIFVKLIILAGIFLTACNSIPRQLNGADYVRWVTSDERPFNKIRKVNNVEIRVRYLPAEYLAYKEFMDSDSTSYDSIYNSYKCGLTFQVSVQAEKSHETYGNLLHFEISDENERAERVRMLSFDIQDFIFLEQSGKRYQPVLSFFEGYDPLGNKMNFQVAFLLPKYNCGLITNEFDPITLSFEDPCWHLGINNFEFQKNIFQDVPHLER